MYSFLEWAHASSQGLSENMFDTRLLASPPAQFSRIFMSAQEFLGLMVVRKTRTEYNIYYKVRQA
jgi:hypothetical protein